MVGKQRVRKLLAAGFCAAIAFGAAPTAQALTLPAPMSTQDTINEWNKQLQPFGVQLPAVDPALAQAIDQSLSDAHREAERLGTQWEQQAAAVQEQVAAAVPVVAPAVPVAPTAGYAVGDPAGPNYMWRNDPVSSIMALTPGPVLHRAPGSWFNAPDVPEASKAAEAQGKSLYGPGTPIFVAEKSMCTVTATGTDAQGRKLAITAGHCGSVGDTVISADSWKLGPSGTVVAQGTNLDYAVIELGSNAQLTSTYNGVTVTDHGAQAQGEILCKQGVATGFTCGVVWANQSAMALSQICAMRGDSGAPILNGNKVVGLVNGGMFPDQNLACATPLQGPLFMPTQSTDFNKVVKDLNARGGVGAGFQLTK
ncbi:S1 family peptidase [Corynebacterium sp. 153RC1]|uniref:S1 family peptidase n=1 Tax=unclassified Corynebacterium TaxID=2624378 RepID=UPI00211B7F21|nr:MULTISPECIES: S1 family peptidase [unclassified Corynebacterium]MCQ9370913.1 S1 family peptidase [Corynebacterium sp. 35RC1]MCQ9353108.1 S1 family peptidase [Corynebacterium sp. 209RC1]MCQ9355312.1 S1 family peptidase [Corynebacterium sp. 1222RC1]MCQ9357599.1 S1 family peptidase [Corynebacterium sp. 122RC1]MCQ9359209.1 S1 family peptidase [Corynebacterium sp. 142RC1]